MFESGWINVLIEDQRNGYSKVEDGETLRTDSEWEDLHCVRYNQGSEGDTAKQGMSV